MSDETANLALPYILPSQAQKHVTHNEALQRLDAVVQLVIAAELADPPPDAAEGGAWLVAAGAGGLWSGMDRKIAFRQDGAWIFIAPREGWHGWFADAGRLRILAGGAWREPDLPATGSMSSLGINATADTDNRLAVASAASLFSHAGQGHQVKVNKAAAADTASLLFQSGWSGRAEMGLAGSDSFAVKVSPDGSLWTTGLAVSPQGVVTMPNRPLARAALGDTALAPAGGSQTGFSLLPVAQGGFALGDAVGSGLGNLLAVPCDGLYFVALQTCTTSSGGHRASLVVNGTTAIAVSGAPASSGEAHASAIGLAALAAGDRLSLLHEGAAQFQFGPGKTEIIVALL